MGDQQQAGRGLDPNLMVPVPAPCWPVLRLLPWYLSNSCINAWMIKHAISWENSQTSFRRPRRWCPPPRAPHFLRPLPWAAGPRALQPAEQRRGCETWGCWARSTLPRRPRAGIQQRQHAAPGRRWVLDGSPASVIVLDAALPSRAVGWSDKTKTQAACEISLLPFSDSLEASPCLRCGHRDISSARTCLRLC